MLSSYKKKVLLNILQEADKIIQIQIAGTSMYPFLKNDDTVFFNVSKNNTYKCGDIIAYYDDNSNIIVHRFIKWKKINNLIFFCQKGDNLLSWSWISIENLIGKAIFIITKDKKKIVLKKQFIKNRITGYIVLIIVLFYESAFKRKKNKLLNNSFALYLWQQLVLFVTNMQKIINNFIK